MRCPQIAGARVSMVSRALWLGMRWLDNRYCSIRKNFFSWTFQYLWNDFFAFQARPRQILKRNFDQSYVEIPGAGAAGAAGKGVSVAVFSLAGGYGHSLKPLWGSLKNVCPKQTCHSRCASGIGDSQNLKKGYVEHAVPLILVAILFVKSWNIYVCAMSRLNLPTFAFSVGCRCASRIATTWCNFPPCDVTFLHLMWLKPANCARMRSSRSANAGVRPVLDLKILRWFEQKIVPRCILLTSLDMIWSDFFALLRASIAARALVFHLNLLKVGDSGSTPPSIRERSVRSQANKIQKNAYEMPFPRFIIAVRHSVFSKKGSCLRLSRCHRRQVNGLFPVFL